jgi:hypothetical protein
VGAAPDPRAFAQALLAQAPVRFFPVRHHSPACAWQLMRALRELRPRHVLIEMPEDFAHLIPLLCDPLLRPPAAIVAFPEWQEGDPPPVAAYWPISATAPEDAAIRVAAEMGAAIRFIDLGAGTRDMREDETHDEPAAAPARVLTQESHLDHSTYVRALAARTGCRDINELWDRLFESRLTDESWQSFFADVGAWCFLARHSTPREQMRREGTLARERCMRAHLAAVQGDPPVAVVTGGFHIPALLDPAAWEDDPSPAPQDPAAARRSRSYLVRFSHARLDSLSGYSAGLPSPRYYELLLAAAQRGERSPHQAVAEEVFLDLAAHLRAERPAFAPPVPALVEALRHACALASLRGLAGPLRSELLDATRATLLKDEDPRYASPLLSDLHQRLVGTAIGDVPPGAGSPPLIEAARRQARALGFTVTDCVTRRRRLDIHRNPRHRAASRFLHAMSLLRVELGRLEQGADYAADVDLDALYEIWSYAWSPLVETQLIEVAADGDDVQRACVSVLLRQCASLSEEGRGGNAEEAAVLLFGAARAGVPPSALKELLGQLEAYIAADADLPRVTAALVHLLLLWSARPVLGFTREARLAAVLGGCYRRAVFLMDTVGASPRERVVEVAHALVAIRDVMDHAGEVATIDAQLFNAAVDSLVEADLPPLLAGVMAAFAVQLGCRPQAFLARCVAGALAGAEVTLEARVAPLAGMLLVVSGALPRMEEVVAGLDEALGALPEDTFIHLLPHLRAAFTQLAPAEAEALGGLLAQRHGSAPEALALDQPIPVSEAELAANVASARMFAALWREDGLGAWLPEEPEG